MLNPVLHFPSHRLKVSLTKRRVLRGEETFVTKVKNILAIRRGSRVSRFFRMLFEQKRIKAFFGGNLTLLALVVSVANSQTSALSAITPAEPQILSAKTIEFTTTVAIRIPMEKTVITQRFSVFHPGIDFDGVTGDPVYPVIKGTIESVVYQRFGYGNHIIINHGSGIKSLYAHLSKVKVVTGEEVETNKEIGQVGSTGRAFGDHLHFEIIENGRHVNPLTVLLIK